MFFFILFSCDFVILNLLQSKTYFSEKVEFLFLNFSVAYRFFNKRINIFPFFDGDCSYPFSPNSIKQSNLNFFITY